MFVLKLAFLYLSFPCSVEQVDATLAEDLHRESSTFNAFWMPEDPRSESRAGFGYDENKK
ncbi:MAG: hypothetical protein VST72_08530 [Nitrospirota bacterium]|nr:hypothetical protein [Nitrospirota bacterium]